MGTITGVHARWIKLYSLKESSSHVILVVALILYVSSPRCYLPFMQRYNPSGCFPFGRRFRGDKTASGCWLTPSLHAFLLEFVSQVNDLAPSIVTSSSSSSFKLKAKNAFVGLLSQQSWGFGGDVSVVSLAVLLLLSVSLPPLSLSLPQWLAAVLCSGQSSVFSCEQPV